MTITDNYETYGNILPGGENAPADDFDVVIAPGCPDGHTITFVVAIESDNRMTWEKQFVCPVEAPVLGLTLWTIDDTGGGNGNGQVDPGETIRVSATLANTGSEDATNLDVEFRIAYGYITILQGSALVEALPAGGSILLAPPFEFSVDLAIPTPNMLPAHIMAAADWGLSADLEFELPVGGLANNMEAGAQGWTHDAMPGWADRWHLETYRNHTSGGTTSWKFGGTGSLPYANRSYGLLETAPFELPAGSVLSFWHWIYAQNPYDGGLLQVSADGGELWETVTPEGGYPYAITQQGPVGPGPFPDGTRVWSGQQDWTEVVVDLGAHAGPAAKLRWVFGSDGSTIYEGWYVDDVFIECGVPTAAVGEGGARILRPLLMPARPNPVVLAGGAGTRGSIVRFALSEAGPMQLSVHDAQGRLVRLLAADRRAAGEYQLAWDGRDARGLPVASGTYYLRLASGESRLVRAVTVVR